MRIAQKRLPPATSDPHLDPLWKHRPEDELATMQANGDLLLLGTMQASLALIGFGFTINQIFSDVAAKVGIARSSPLASRVGIFLLFLGLILLAGGLWTDIRTRRQVRARRAEFAALGLVDPSQRLAIAPVFVVALLLLLMTLTILAAIAVRLLA